MEEVNRRRFIASGRGRNRPLVPGLLIARWTGWHARAASLCL